MKERFTIVVVSIFTIAACAVFASTLVHASLYYQPEEEIFPAALGIATSTSGSISPHTTSLRLRIPAINVDAAVQSVGIGKSGNMAVPTNFTDVGLYRYGPKPGEVGSAVIDGHVDNGFGMNAVFKHITELKPGDDIFIENASSSPLHFVVTDIETYAAADVPTDILFSRNDVSRLNLITCAGVWDGSAEAYDHRTVVYATLK